MSCQKSVITHPLPKSEVAIISEEITKFLSKEVIVESYSEPEEYKSGFFTRNKKDGTKRIILNLKNFNKFINYKHFKMESIDNGTNF